MSTKNHDEVTTVDIKTKDHYEVTIDYNNTNNSTMKKVKKKKLQKKTIWSKKKGSMWKEPVEKIFTTIQSTKFLVIAYIWRFILIVLLLIYVYKYSNSKIETVTVLVTDVIIGYIFINMSLRMSLEFHDRIIHIILLTAVVWLTSFSYYIPILFLVLDQKDKHIHLFMFAVIFILDFIVCSFALGTSVRRKYRLEEQDSSDIKHDELVIKNYHTSITIKGPITKLEELKNAYTYYKVSLYGAHLILSVGCLFIIKWCLLTIGRIVDPTIFYDAIPWPLLFPICTFFTIFIGARTLSKNAIFFYIITIIFQVLYLLQTILCHFSFIECNKSALPKNAQKGFEILSAKHHGLFILSSIDLVSLFITVIVLLFLIYWRWKIASSDETLHELKMHLEYVPADELIYHNCKDYLEKDLKKHIKCPFLMHNPYDPYEKDDEQQ
ncbi:hypothetical protein F8M41_006328 [Gigaspora margarita]|uniref:Uncharacterized protein n=1 Tax=Gigaspora margarita TaxID=4874 RepID=A0A8H4AWU2_GIGMA|nr:hypothetical protein F8M41_006328 [Gigaspora margarita]